MMSQSKTGFTGSDACNERITIRMETDQLEEIDALVEAGEYANRSAAIRQLADDGLDQRGDN